MKALLDTHVFLWAINEPNRLSPAAKTIIADADNTLFFSAASAWEIAIKTQLGKLKLPEQAETYILRHMSTASIDPLPIELSHALRVASLPLHHRDPFDRLLVAQAQQEKLSIITADPLIGQYAVKVIW